MQLTLTQPAESSAGFFTLRRGTALAEKKKKKRIADFMQEVEDADFDQTEYLGVSDLVSTVSGSLANCVSRVKGKLASRLEGSLLYSESQKQCELAVKISKNANQWNLYLLECSDGSWYTGVALNVIDRVKKHNAGSGSLYVRSRRPAKLVASAGLLTKGVALQTEYAIKQLASHDLKLAELNKLGNITIY